MQRLTPSLMLVLLVGCGVPKLEVEKKSFDLDINGTTFKLAAVKAEQKINVAVTASGGPADVYVFLTKNESTAEKDIMAKRLGGLIASEEGKYEKGNDEVKEWTVSLRATIPANEEASIW